MNKRKLYRGLATGLSAVLSSGYPKHQKYDAVTIREAIAELNRSSWISVKKQMPQRKTQVLCANENGDVYENCTDYKGRWFFDNGFITHWQPLPNPPQRNQKDQEYA